jgi:hypothetical protein
MHTSTNASLGNLLKMSELPTLNHNPTMVVNIQNGRSMDTVTGLQVVHGTEEDGARWMESTSGKKVVRYHLWMTHGRHVQDAPIRCLM